MLPSRQKLGIRENKPMNELPDKLAIEVANLHFIKKTNEKEWNLF